MLIQAKVLTARRWFVSRIVQLLIDTSLLRLEVWNKACNNAHGINKRDRLGTLESKAVMLTLELSVHDLHLAKHILLPLGG